MGAEKAVFSIKFVVKLTVVKTWNKFQITNQKVADVQIETQNYLSLEYKSYL